MNAWDDFSKRYLIKIFTEKRTIIDIGGGLRIDPEKNNRFNASNQWMKEYIAKVDYKILDKVDTYKPDIVGDVHDLPFDDNSIDAVICAALLEHVERPHTAVSEIYRVLKPGGYAYFYVPFLYYYHPMKGYYKDYFRFTKDGIEYLFRDFSELKLQNVRGAVETVTHLLPHKIARILRPFASVADRVFKKDASYQTSGYHIFAIK